jgi:hypothetical protein
MNETMSARLRSAVGRAFEHDELPRTGSTMTLGQFLEVTKIEKGVNPFADIEPPEMLARAATELSAFKVSREI